MKTIVLFLIAFTSLFAISCDLRSGTAKEEMEKWQDKPSPSVAPSVSPTPIDPADIVQVDTSVQGDTISVNGDNQTKSIACTKYNRVTINSDNSTVTAKGLCQSININGDGNKITVEASMGFVIYGGGNTIKYSRYANGNVPSVTKTRDDNVVEKISAGAAAGQPNRKQTK